MAQDPEAAWSVWSEEYKQVVSGFDQINGQGCSVEVFKPVGLAVVSCPEPLHYYSIFSQVGSGPYLDPSPFLSRLPFTDLPFLASHLQTCGCDYVLTLYDRNRYELECKYTQVCRCLTRPLLLS